MPARSFGDPELVSSDGYFPPSGYPGLLCFFIRSGVFTVQLCAKLRRSSEAKAERGGPRRELSPPRPDKSGQGAEAPPWQGRRRGRAAEGGRLPSRSWRRGRTVLAASPGRAREAVRRRRGTRSPAMANAKRQKNDTNTPEEIHVDSKNILQCKDDQQNFTETDAFDERISQLFDPSVEYKMKHKRRGLALIFNHERFFWHLMLPERRGTRTDRDNLNRSLTELGFEVKCFDDLRAEEVLQNIYNVSTDQHEDADCFMCIFLSHGEDNHVYAYDAKIEIQTLTSMFRGDKCRSLIGKPKIFIIQACRGDKHDNPVLVHDMVDSATEGPLVNEIKVDAAAVYTLPAGADFLMCYSVAEGFYSHRETVNGSWYIQDLCEMIRKHGASLEFTELLMLVNRKVSHRKVDVCKDIQAIGKKQVPCFASMLTKKLYFYPKS